MADISRAKAVLFDLDGTLADSAPDMVAAATILCEREGHSAPDPVWVRNHVSQGVAGVIRAAFPDTEQAARERLAGEFLDLYRQTLGMHCGLFPGVDVLLDQLEAHARPWGIVTNKPEEFARPLLAELGLIERTGALICGDTLASKKPDPAGLLKACEMLGVAPADCPYVGDDPRDVQAAHAAGSVAVAAAWGYFTNDSLPRTWGAELIASNADELSRQLGLTTTGGGGG